MNNPLRRIPGLLLASLCFFGLALLSTVPIMLAARRGEPDPAGAIVVLICPLIWFGREVYRAIRRQGIATLSTRISQLFDLPCPANGGWLDGPLS